MRRGGRSCSLSARWKARDQFEAVGRRPLRVRNSRSWPENPPPSSHPWRSVPAGARWHRPWPGLGFAGLVEGDVGLGDVEVTPAFRRQLKGLGPEHHHLGGSQAGVVGHSGHHLVGPAGDWRWHRSRPPWPPGRAGCGSTPFEPPETPCAGHVPAAVAATDRRRGPPARRPGGCRLSIPCETVRR